MTDYFFPVARVREVRCWSIPGFVLIGALNLPFHMIAHKCGKFSWPAVQSCKKKLIFMHVCVCVSMTLCACAHVCERVCLVVVGPHFLQVKSFAFLGLYYYCKHDTVYVI